MIKKMAALAALGLFLFLGIGWSDRQLSEIRGSHWEVSPQFTYFSMSLLGEHGHLAIQDVPFDAKVKRNYSWFFWENPRSLYGKPFRVTGVQWKTGKRYVLYEGAIPSRNGTGMARAARALSTLSLPTKGLWKLEAAVNGDTIGSVVVEVR